MRVPSASRYRAALKQIYGKITPLQWRMLEAHFLAPDHTASTGEIASAAGKPRPVAHRHYGGLAKKIRVAIDKPIVSGEQQLDIVGILKKPDQSYPFHRWVMHAPLATAIRDLCWFETDDIGTQPVEKEPNSHSAQEGRQQRMLIIHRQRERSLRRAKLDAFRIEHNGRLFCEVPGCGFDFEVMYGDLGSGFAEVHHLRPLSELEQPVSTALPDLAVVCANCHRMIHRNNDCRPLNHIIPNSVRPSPRKRP